MKIDCVQLYAGKSLECKEMEVVFVFLLNQHVNFTISRFVP